MHILCVHITAHQRHIFFISFLIFLLIGCKSAYLVMYSAFFAYFSLYCAYLCTFNAYLSIYMHIYAYSSSAGPLHWPALGLTCSILVPLHSTSFISTVYCQLTQSSTLVRCTSCPPGPGSGWRRAVPNYVVH